MHLLRKVTTFQTFLADVIAAQKSTSGASSPTYLVVR